MSFLIPKIESKNPKEAWRAFRLVTRSDEEIYELLRRNDIVIRDQIYDWAFQYRLSREARQFKSSKLYSMILNDPAHPYYSKVKKMDDEERAADTEKRKKERVAALNRILHESNAGSDLLESARIFAGKYDMSIEEKRLIGNAVLRYIDGISILHMGHEEKKRQIAKNIQPFLCPPLILEHLKDLPADHELLGNWALQLIEKAITDADIPDEEKREACLRFRVSDGKNVTDCEIGKHQYVLIGEEQEENHEDFYHPFDYKVYRCTICGDEIRKKGY